MKLSRFLSPLKPKHGTPCPSSNSKQEALDKAPLWGGHLMPNGTPLFPPHLREDGNITHLLDSCTKETFFREAFGVCALSMEIRYMQRVSPPSLLPQNRSWKNRRQEGLFFHQRFLFTSKKESAKSHFTYPATFKKVGIRAGGGGSKGANPKEQMVCPTFLWTISSPYSSTCWSLFNLSHNLLLCKEGMFQICKKKIFFF